MCVVRLASNIVGAVICPRLFATNCVCYGHCACLQLCASEVMALPSEWKTDNKVPIQTYSLQDVKHVAAQKWVRGASGPQEIHGLGIDHWDGLS